MTSRRYESETATASPCFYTNSLSCPVRSGQWSRAQLLFQNPLDGHGLPKVTVVPHPLLAGRRFHQYDAASDSAVRCPLMPCARGQGVFLTTQLNLLCATLCSRAR